MGMGPDDDCPQTFTAEAVGALGDGTPMLLQIKFTITELSPADPRRPGDGFLHGDPCPCLLHAHLQMAQALAFGGMERL